MLTVATLKKAQSDPTLKEEGVWQEFPIAPDVEPLKLKLRSIASNKVRIWDLARFRKQRAYYIGDHVPPITVLDQNEADRLAEVIVVEWNVTDDAGTPAPCTVENVRAAMMQLPDTRRDAIVAAAKHENYRLAEVEAVSKNSETPSLPTSGTGAGAA